MNESDFFPDYIWDMDTGHLMITETNTPFINPVTSEVGVFANLETAKHFLKEYGHTGRLAMKVSKKVC